MRHPDYRQFTSRDFVLDEYFCRWVLQPDEETRAFWQTYRLKHPEQQSAIDEAASMLLHLWTKADTLSDASQQRIWQVLDQAADKQLAVPVRIRDLPLAHYNPVRQRLIWLAAASLTTLLLITGLYWYRLQPHRQIVHTGYGESRSVTLPDGSIVLLNGNSTLTYVDKWNDDRTREVWLEGEGFFKVTRQATSQGKLKFITHTPSLDITVLGTQFNVNTRRGNTQVTLVEGRVQLSKPGRPETRIIEMKPGELASAVPNAEAVEVHPDKPERHTAWVQQQFIFDDTPLRDIAQQLNDTYGLTIIFEDDQLADRRFTANLSSQSPETLLTVIAETYDLEANRTDNQVTLRRR